MARRRNLAERQIKDAPDALEIWAGGNVYHRVLATLEAHGALPLHESARRAGVDVNRIGETMMTLRAWGCVQRVAPGHWAVVP